MTIALYARKSHESSSESIKNQLSIMRRYIQNNADFKGANLLEFYDDGCSGIDMNRDSFQKLLTKVRMREIDVIIVKDLSRLGRNYLDVCKLTESIFPFMGVRLIAIADNYDSNNKEQNTIDLSTTFKAVLNEFYVTETSEKIRCTFNQMVRSGKYIGKLPYGYFLSDDKLPLIDEDRADIVRKIYRLYADDMSIYEIARTLNIQDIPSCHGKKWCDRAIRQVLANPAYIGIKICFVRTRDLKTHRLIINDKKDWYIRENAYPPIVDKELFEQVQQLMLSRRKTAPASSSERHFTCGKLHCVKCGRVLHRTRNCFRCRNGAETGTEPCFKGALKAEMLYPVLLEKIKQYLGAELEKYKHSFSFSDMSAIEDNITALKEKKAELFTKFFDGEIAKDELDKSNADISSQITALEADLSDCRRVIALNTKYKSERPIDTLKRLYGGSELSKEHMQFVQRVDVFSADRFEIIMQPESPLAVLCKNMDIYEEV